MHDILLVEDNPDDVDLTMRAFRKTELVSTVAVARDGIQALDYLFATGQYADRDPAELPRLVLLDLKLPRLDGLQVLERVRANPVTRIIPVVILTSSTEQRDLRSGYALGANSYIRKPVDFEQFVDALGHINTYWLEMNQLPGPITPM
jgi:two-component system response regulator